LKRAHLIEKIRNAQTLLCVGLDTDIKRLPQFLIDNYEDPITEFNRRIISATKDHCVAYKFNIAFYESQGASGWQSLEKSLALIPSGIFTIADAKRGDIGNTSKLYARTFFETFNFDAITVAPYMGHDSLEPFYGYDDKWVVILGLTSNPGSHDFQQQKLKDGRRIFESVIARTAQYGNAENTMYVVGATRAEDIKVVRDLVPDHFFLMPGIGKQGGDLQKAMQYGLNEDYGLLINSSRGIIYASDSAAFAEDAAAAAIHLNSRIKNFL